MVFQHILNLHLFFTGSSTSKRSEKQDQKHILAKISHFAIRLTHMDKNYSELLYS